MLARRLAGIRKLLGDFIADAEEDLVGSLSLKGRMRHHFIVLVDVELDESSKTDEAVERMELQPRVLQRSPECLDH